jgi:hypothetical protein
MLIQLFMLWVCAIVAIDRWKSARRSDLPPEGPSKLRRGALGAAYAERDSGMVALAKEINGRGGRVSLRKWRRNLPVAGRGNHPLRRRTTGRG